MKIPYAALCVIMVVLLSEAHLTKAVTCSLQELVSCAAAFTSSSPPSTTCCSKLKEQKPCLCGYRKDPNFGRYLNSAKGKQIASTCGVQLPKC